MAHRLFHSLVLSSVMALEGSGCTSIHERPPPTGDAGGPWLDAGGPWPVDAGELTDADRAPLADASAPVDAGRPTDAGRPGDAGEPSDGGAPGDGGDLRLCEPGWPTTKAFFCTELENGDIVCCDSILLPDGGERCCLEEGE